MADDPTPEYVPSAGVLHFAAGLGLLALATLLVGQVVESPDLVRLLIVGLGGSGLYLLIVGAVARGVQLERRVRPIRQDQPLP